MRTELFGDLRSKRVLPRNGARNVDAGHGCAAIGFRRKVIRMDRRICHRIGARQFDLAFGFRAQLADRHGEG